MSLMTAPKPPSPPPDPARLFIALWPDEGVRRQLQAWQRAVSWPKGSRLAAPAGLHMTLHFNGAVARSRLSELARGLAVAPVPAFELSLDAFAVWHHGIAVLETSLPVPDPLKELHSRLAEALRALELPVEPRPFRPHVTFARHGQGAALAVASLPPVRWPCDGGYVLAESAGGYHLLSTFAVA